MGLQRWETRVPTNPSDEIFLSGLSFLVPYNFPGGIKPVTWTGDFTVDRTGVTVEWKWGAAVYTTDMAVIQIAVFVITIMALTINLATDALYRLIDPRLRP